MRQIREFSLETPELDEHDEISFPVPGADRILSALGTDPELALFVLVDTEKPTRNLRVRIVDTDTPAFDGLEDWQFLCSVFAASGYGAWHAFAKFE